MCERWWGHLQGSSFQIRRLGTACVMPVRAFLPRTAAARMHPGVMGPHRRTSHHTTLVRGPAPHRASLPTAEKLIPSQTALHVSLEHGTAQPTKDNHNAHHHHR